MLAALRAAGTSHVFGDSADVPTLAALRDRSAGPADPGLDGNTINQPLLEKVLPTLLEAEAGHDPLEEARTTLRQLGAPYSDGEALYTVLLARVGRDAVRRLRPEGGRWDVSLQLPMAASASYERLVQAGRFLHALVPEALAKVPFRPDAPHTLLAARALAREGVRVNLTSTFSARQALVAARVADAALTNVFLGRLDAALGGEGVGVRTTLEAQRVLLTQRLHERTRTRLIAASMHHWQVFDALAGVDAFTAPPETVRDFLEQDELRPAALRSRLDDMPEWSLGAEAAQRVESSAVTRLMTVEPELLEFLDELEPWLDAETRSDGDALRARFDAAGFGDLFHDPGDVERVEARTAKLPDLDGNLVRTVPLDTHFSLLANADFEKHQEAIDAAIVDASTASARA